MAFTNKTFFITGAANGLGKAYMEAVLERGAKVYFGDVNEELGNQTRDEMVAKYGSEKVKFKAFDVTDKAAFEGAFSDAVSTFQQVDIMVNNAGIMNESLWDLMIKINITGVVHGTKLATEHMRKDRGGKGGRIINISSITGLLDPYCLPIYAGTKHAVRSFTSSLALQPDIEAQGVQYGILCPSATATDLVSKLDDTKIGFADQMIDVLITTMMPVQTVVDAFLELVQLKNMNNAILLVNATDRSYKKMEMVEVPHPDEPKAEPTQKEA